MPLLRFWKEKLLLSVGLTEACNIPAKERISSPDSCRELSDDIAEFSAPLVRASASENGLQKLLVAETTSNQQIKANAFFLNLILLKIEFFSVHSAALPPHPIFLPLPAMGIFSNLFSSSPASEPIDLAILGTDVHSHFIPGIDDGAQTMDDSLQLIGEMAAMGYKKVITTPHIMSDSYRNTPEIILGGLEKVRAALKQAGTTIEIGAAAEYYVDFDFERKLKEEKLLTFGKNYVLFEISFMNPPENLTSVIFQLQTNGYKPVLAHPERYNFWHKEFNKYEEFIERGVLLQMNINSLTGHYSPATKKVAEQMIEKGMISFIGSDCHHMGHVELIKKVRAEKYLRKLIESGKLLNTTL